MAETWQKQTRQTAELQVRGYAEVGGPCAGRSRADRLLSDTTPNWQSRPEAELRDWPLSAWLDTIFEVDVALTDNELCRC